MKRVVLCSVAVILAGIAFVSTAQGPDIGRPPTIIAPDLPPELKVGTQWKVEVSCKDNSFNGIDVNLIMSGA